MQARDSGVTLEAEFVYRYKLQPTGPLGMPYEFAGPCGVVLDGNSGH